MGAPRRRGRRGFNEVGDLTAVDSRSRMVEVAEQAYKGERQGLIRN
ncbi:hypothetical protein [Nocardiopsis sp. LOL_012]